MVGINKEELKGLSSEEIHSLLEFDFENGIVKFKMRSSSRFKNQNQCNAWNGRNAGKICNSKDANGYVCVRLNRVQFYVHRLMFFAYYGIVPEKVDHKNGIKDDNRISNLRNATHRQNIQNSKVFSTSKTKYRGIHFYKTRNKYQVHITVNYKTIHLGYYEKLEDAIEARKNAEEKYKFENFRD